MGEEKMSWFKNETCSICGRDIYSLTFGIECWLIIQHTHDIECKDEYEKEFGKKTAVITCKDLDELKRRWALRSFL